VTDHPAYAIIHVKESPSCDAWPIVERVPGGWSSGVHHYEDSRVIDLMPLHLVPDSGLQWGVRTDSTGKVEECAEASAWLLQAPDQTPVNRPVGEWQTAVKPAGADVELPGGAA
jgi:hypothetical protein